MVTKEMLKNALTQLGVEKGMVLEVHSSLSSFGELEGGAETVINTLKEIVTEEGSIFMPALRLSRELPLTEEDKKLGITVKIKVLPPDSDRTAMGLVADTFRKLPDTYTGQNVISTSGWGRHGKEVLTGGLDYPIRNGGKALMLGVDIYKLTAMHYVEGITPDDINKIFEPTDEINRKYPPDKWFMEAGHPPVKAWYKIQEMAYEKGLIRETAIGDCKVMFFDIWSVLSLYENELKRDPYGLWGMIRHEDGETNVLNVGRIFVAPEHFRKGYGSFMMLEVESLFPEVKEFTLDTPVWNVRTNVFYSKLGYKEIKHDEESVFYIKYRGEYS